MKATCDIIDFHLEHGSVNSEMEADRKSRHENDGSHHKKIVPITVWGNFVAHDEGL